MIRNSTAALALALSACASGGPSTPGSTGPAVVHGAASASSRYQPRMRASPPAQPALPSPVAVALDAAALAAAPRETIVAEADGEFLRCEGIALIALLRASGAMPGGPLHGAHLARYVLVDARNGERALYALAELDPTLAPRRVYLVDRCGGRPLPDQEGPLRLIAPDEPRQARWLRQVEAITVVVAP